MNFKDIVSEDIDNVFFNMDELGQSHIIDGQSVNCIVDNDRLIERSKKEFDGIYVGELLMYIKKSDLGRKLTQDMPLIVDNQQMYIFSLREDAGVYEIIFNRNAGA